MCNNLKPGKALAKKKKKSRELLEGESCVQMACQESVSVTPVLAKFAFASELQVTHQAYSGLYILYILYAKPSDMRKRLQYPWLLFKRNYYKHN